MRLTGQDSCSNSNVGLQPEPSLLKRFISDDLSFRFEGKAKRHIMTGSILTQGLLVTLAGSQDLCWPPLHVGLGGVKLLVGLQVVLQDIVGRALAAPVADLECFILE